MSAIYVIDRLSRFKPMRRQGHGSSSDVALSQPYPSCAGDEFGEVITSPTRTPPNKFIFPQLVPSVMYHYPHYHHLTSRFIFRYLDSQSKQCHQHTSNQVWCSDETEPKPTPILYTWKQKT